MKETSLLLFIQKRMKDGFSLPPQEIVFEGTSANELMKCLESKLSIPASKLFVAKFDKFSSNWLLISPKANEIVSLKSKPYSLRDGGKEYSICSIPF